MLDADGIEHLIKEKIRKLIKEKKVYEREIAALEESLRQQVNISTQFIALTDLCVTLSESLNRLSFEDKRSALAALRVRVTAEGKDNWKLELGFPIPPDKPESGGGESRQKGTNILILWSDRRE